MENNPTTTLFDAEGKTWLESKNNHDEYFDREEEEEEIPSYLVPTYASVAASQANTDAEIIREAYCTGNYTAIRDLPDYMRPGEIEQRKKLKQLEAKKSRNCPDDILKMRRDAVRRNGLFGDFEYIPSRYTLQKEVDSRDKLESKMKALRLGHDRDFMYSSNARKLKHEDCFDTENFQYGYQSGEYDALQNKITEEKRSERSKKLYGAFVPSGKRHESSTGGWTKTIQPEIASRIEEILCDDWKECHYIVEWNDSGNLEIRFPIAEIQNDLPSLKAYMNSFESCHYYPKEHGLVRNSKMWAKVESDGYVHYALRPPWVKQAVNIGL